MSYNINAWLARDGTPQLQIIDADSGCVRLAWQAGTSPLVNDPAVKGLFRELMLLSALENLGRR